MEWRMPVKLHTAVFAKKWSSKAVRTLEPSMFPAHGTFGGGWPTLHLQQDVEIFAPEWNPLFHESLS